MTRSKDHRRIEAALRSRDPKELRWALSWAEMRLKHATMKHHQKHFRPIAKQVAQVLEQLDEAGTRTPNDPPACEE